MPVRFNGRVPELPGHTIRAAPDRAAHDQSAAHAGTESQYGHVGIILGRTQPFFSERRDVGVVFEDHNRLQALLNRGASGIVDPVRQVGRFAHYASLHIDDAGHTDADPNSGAEFLYFSSMRWTASHMSSMT